MYKEKVVAFLEKERSVVRGCHCARSLSGEDRYECPICEIDRLIQHIERFNVKTTKCSSNDKEPKNNGRYCEKLHVLVTFLRNVSEFIKAENTVVNDYEIDISNSIKEHPGSSVNNSSYEISISTQSIETAVMKDYAGGFHGEKKGY